MIIRKSQDELQAMREAGRLTALTHDVVAAAVRPGITTASLDALAEEFIRDHDAIPAFKGYNGYPASICVSVNEEVVHGIPGARILRDGDIVSIDIGVVLDGFYGDMARTYPVGEISEEAKRLIAVTETALEKGIAAAVAGNRLSDIGHAVQSYVEAHGMSVVRDFVGHGIGRSMHEEPQIPNFGRPGYGPRLKPGMVLAIEPMVNVGGWEVIVLSDNWTVVTADRSLSAHFEDTVAVTEGGPLILTQA
ncbi:MAG: type I methionyl aminopeptidase [Firmicutes bacterium]|jgi:methionyl aminopeptidase|nr:type I methionyl aminopeptidase [Bacillota bacterium]